MASSQCAAVLTSYRQRSSGRITTGGTPFASSTGSGSAATAFDGSGTGWQATAGAPQQIGYQFSGFRREIVKVQVTWGFTGNKAYNLEWSDDGVSYTSAGSTGTYSATASTPETHSFNPAGEHAYWRLNITTYAGSAVVALNDILMTEA